MGEVIIYIGGGGGDSRGVLILESKNLSTTKHFRSPLTGLCPTPAGFSLMMTGRRTPPEGIIIYVLNFMHLTPVVLYSMLTQCYAW